ncbi:E3 ubiquitin-protein ligase TRIM38-like isoform X3 [Talpa occidentalis]|uniref:E3 ubiquitin-protein ligase TRIM38-like isoform X3 n=1 Tax=Talpa occidentalis TaxID=50954 RepID=UPI0023F8A41A|nr:E3 ubiquitin-protein ligase TRIM38-like isoform X3 [Talpa occidentalis]
MTGITLFCHRGTGEASFKLHPFLSPERLQHLCRRRGSGRAMASATATKKMREEATCSICLELMTKPVSIHCGHSFCRQCIEVILENLQGTSSLREPQCPLCRTPFQRASLRSNTQLENLIQTLKEIDRERLCEEHGERLHLFCEDDGQPICLLCERSPQHRGHRMALVEDVYPGYKEKLQAIVTKLKREQDYCKFLKVLQKDDIRQWENIELRRQEIQSEFRNLHNFLDEEERAYLRRLQKEKEELLARLQEREASLVKQSSELESLILELERKCEETAQNLLQGVKDTLKRHSDVKLKIPKDPSLDPQTVSNFSELYFDLKKMLQRYQVSVTLDPYTAHCELILSEERRRVTRGSPQKKHFSIKRFHALPCVLGCEGFTSGRRYFEVHVGEGSGWVLGVCLENVQRDRDMTPKPQSGFWAIRLCQKKGYMALTSPPTPLALKEKPLLMGVFLACEAGLVSFYNMNTGSHIFTFPRASFSGTLRPYFQVNHCSPLFLPPPLESF